MQTQNRWLCPHSSSDWGPIILFQRQNEEDEEGKEKNNKEQKTCKLSYTSLCDCLIRPGKTLR
jgi:hypothetical protein